MGISFAHWFIGSLSSYLWEMKNICRKKRNGRFEKGRIHLTGPHKGQKYKK